ncbi:unnamed protein product [Caenorhabditis bovis]|nr:unnamed protein product [Caenorhabditis bovis]
MEYESSDDDADHVPDYGSKNEEVSNGENKSDGKEMYDGIESDGSYQSYEKNGDINNMKEASGEENQSDKDEEGRVSDSYEKSGGAERWYRKNEWSMDSNEQNHGERTAYSVESNRFKDLSEEREFAGYANDSPNTSSEKSPHSLGSRTNRNPEPKTPFNEDIHDSMANED